MNEAKVYRDGQNEQIGVGHVWIDLENNKVIISCGIDKKVYDVKIDVDTFIHMAKTLEKGVK